MMKSGVGSGTSAGNRGSATSGMGSGSNASVGSGASAGEGSGNSSGEDELPQLDGSKTPTSFNYQWPNYFSTTVSLTVKAAHFCVRPHTCTHHSLYPCLRCARTG